MKQLVVVIMGQDCKDFAELCLESVKDADAIVFCDGGSKPEFLDWLQTDEEFSWEDNTEHRVLIQQEFSQTDPLMNSKQRNFYLDFLKKNYAGWWALCLDADEVVHDLSKIKEFIQTVNDGVLFSPKMRHFIYHFGLEDATQQEHWVPNRLFCVREGPYYPEGEHAALTEKNGFFRKTDATTIWHLAYSPLFHIRRRFRKNTAHSEVHSKEFLRQWRDAHLFGHYPVRLVDPKELPTHLLRGYDVDPDSLYFSDRGLEVKHFIDAGHWRDHFHLFDGEGNSAIEWGCGLGPRVLAMRTAYIQAWGYELSQFAVDHRMCPQVELGDVTRPYVGDKARLVVAYDVLEHIPYEKLDGAIETIKNSSEKYILVSVPVIGNPDLLKDPTHIVKEHKEWWVEKFEAHGLKQLPVPAHFLFRDQLMIWEVTGGS